MGATIFSVSLLMTIGGAAAMGEVSAIDQIMKLKPEEQVAVVVAGMHQYDASLENLSFEVQQEFVYVTAIKKTDPIVDVYQVKRFGQAISLQSESKSLDKKQSREFKSVSDAHGFRILTSLEGVPQQYVIRSEESSILANIGYCDMLGLRAENETVSLGAWADKRILQKDVAASVDHAKLMGEDSLKLTLVKTQGASRETESIWLDPSKGWIILQDQYECVTPTGTNRELTTATNLKQFGKTWLPDAARRECESSANPGAKDIYEYKTKNIEVGTVKAAEMDLPIPKECNVVDYMKRIGFRLNVDGTTTEIPWIDGRSGSKVSRSQSASGPASTTQGQ